MFLLISKIWQLIDRARRRISGQRYGIMTPLDEDFLDSTVFSWHTPCDKGMVRVVEVGVHRGHTAAGLRSAFKRRGIRMEYVGVDVPCGKKIDPRRCNPFYGARVIRDGRDVVGDFDLVLIDGCHCAKHVAEDIEKYAKHVGVGGCILFHDTARSIPIRAQFQDCGNFTRNDEDGYIAVRRVVERWKETDWKNEFELVGDVYDATYEWGGFMMYRRIA